jgi:hypothetical protein
MIRHVKAATIVALGLLLLLLVPTAAQAAPPSCLDGSFVTTPGQRVALPASPCTDPDAGDTYTLAVATQPSHGTVAADMGTNYYTPSAGYHGTDEFTYTATDSHMEQSAEATVQILIDTAPDCTNNSATVQSGKRLALPLICDDADGDDLDIFLSDPLHGTLDLTGPDAIYSSTAGYVGQDAITYDAEDPFGRASSTVTLTITVTAPPAQTPPQSPPAAPPNDATAPAFSLASPSTKLKPALKKGLRLVLTPNEGGTATIRLTVDRATARKLKLKRNAKGPFKVGGLKTTLASGQSTVVVKLTAKARKALTNVRKVKLLITVVMTDPAGNSATHTMKVTLKR